MSSRPISPAATAQTPSLDPLADSLLQQGLKAHQNNLWDEAIASYQKTLLLEPQHFKAHLLLSLISIQIRQFLVALQWSQKALFIEPTSGEAHFHHGLAQHGLGHLPEAIAQYEWSICFNPEQAEAYSNRAIALAALHEWSAVLLAYQRAIYLQPDRAELYCNRGVGFKALNQMDAALKDYEQAICFKPDFTEAYSNRGVVLTEQEEYSRAVESFDQAILLNPLLAETHSNRSMPLRSMDKLNQALASCERALSLSGQNTQAYLNRGATLEALKRSEEAIESYNMAIALHPQYFEAYSNRGASLRSLELFSKALENHDFSIHINSHYHEAYFNKANALIDSHRLEIGFTYFDKAIELKPYYPVAYWNKSLALLLAAQYQEGWRLYEWRWKRDPLIKNTREFSQPLWLGEENLQGKTLLIHCEQGFGDTLQFSRFVPRLLTLAKHVIFELPAPLLELLQSLPGTIEFIPHGQTLPAFDYHCPLMSLPLALSVLIDDLEPTQTYLSPPKEKINLWHERVKSHQKPLIGLAWRGNPEHLNDAKRSLALRDIIDKLPSHVTWISLQAFINDEEKKILQNQDKLLHFEDSFESFSSTAALCMNLSAVVSVDTSIAHLAGALGLPLSLLLPFNPDWRWLLNRSDSPWYKTARLYRQPAPGQWAPAIDKLLQDLPLP